MAPISNDDLAARLDSAYPELKGLVALTRDPVFLVGGGVRNLLLGLERSTNLDLIVEGDATELAAQLGADVREHGRFATATARMDGLEVDVAAARTESYSHPGALPDVTPGAGIESDLGRRDFTINAIAVPLSEPRLIDPHGGEADLEAGLLRVLHPASFVDDPTRALRGARYAARLDMSLEPQTERLLRATDLETVSADRRRAELLRLAAETSAPSGFELLGEWGLAVLREGGIELAERVAALLSSPPWEGHVARDRAVLTAALGPPGGEGELAAARPGSPSEAVRLAGGHDPLTLVLARAQGAEWLDRYLGEWRQVSLEIDGEDLIAAGVPEGPAVGRGLAAALRMKLDGELGAGRAEELAAAIASARSGDALA